MLAAYWRGQCIKEAHIPPGAMAAVGRCCPGTWCPYMGWWPSVRFPQEPELNPRGDKNAPPTLPPAEDPHDLG